MEQIRLIVPAYEDEYTRRCHHEVQGCRKPVWPIYEYISSWMNDSYTAMLIREASRRYRSAKP
jgi:hypothetical protein